MHICVLNGSPRGQYSITIQTSFFLEQKFPQHQFSYFDIGTKINAYEKDMSEVIAGMQEADLIIFSYPVYTFLAPSQMHRFVRALKECEESFAGKFVTQITTSKHFYDITAHRYIEDNCHDLGMKVIKGLSADMEDLTSKNGQQDAVDFFNYVQWCIKEDVFEASTMTLLKDDVNYIPGMFPSYKNKKYTIAIVADLLEQDINLKKMIADFEAAMPCATKLVNIATYPFKGGCLGCFNCVGDGKCIYTDNFDVYLREEIQICDAIVYAFSIVDHSMGPRFKIYDDRQFCNGHRTVTEGKPVGYIVNGDYKMEGNLRTVIEARAQVGHNFLAGVGTNADSIKDMCRRIVYSIEHSYILPRNFWGVGGMKIFRDLIWLMRGLMKADHEYYKKHGIYDFPQTRKGTILLMYILGAIIRNPKIKRKMGNKMNEAMVAPYRKVIDEAK